MKTLKESAVRIAFVCLLFHGYGTATFADGCYLPDRAVQKLPGIPTQRALLSWRDGTETLVISSALDSEAQRLGWLVPVPSVPRDIAKTDPGALKTLEFCIQPHITHDLSRVARAWTVVVAWMLVAVAIWVFARSRLAFFLVVTLPFLLFAAMLLPALGTARTTAATVSGVRVEKTAMVGAYEISVLTAGGAGDVNGWLTKNEMMPLPTAAEPIIADYVRRGWKFVAIKLTRVETGMNTPHPIKFVFPATEAVYPWQLTTLAGGQPLLELFVVGNTRAAVSGLTTEFCQRFSSGSGWGGAQVFKAEEAKVAVGHPGVMPLLWDGCVLTKLSGHIDVRRQTGDLPVRWIDFAAHQQHLYTTVGARYVAWIVAVSVLGVMLGWGLLVYAAGPRERDQRRSFFQRCVPQALLASLLAAAITYGCLPKLRTSDTQVLRHGFMTSLSFPRNLVVSIGVALDQEPDLHQKDEHAIAEAILHRLPGLMRGAQGRGSSETLNLLQGGDVKVESSPGNFTVEKRDGKIVVRIYDQAGSPTEVEY